MRTIQLGGVYRRVRNSWAGKHKIFRVVEPLIHNLYRVEIIETNGDFRPNYSGDEKYPPYTVYSIGANIILDDCVRIDLKEVSKEDIV